MSNLLNKFIEKFYTLIRNYYDTCKKIILLAFTFVLTIGITFAKSSLINFITGIWRVNPTTGWEENLDDVCTLTVQPILCEVVFPSEDLYPDGSSIYYTSQTLWFEFPPRSVFYIP